MTNYTKCNIIIRMNISDPGEPLLLEVLCKPEVKDTATYFNVFLSESPCCRRRCCHKGRSINGSAIYAHEQGIVIQKRQIYLLNNGTEVSCPPPAKELEIVRNGCTKVLDWIIPTKAIRAIEHPWGAIIFESQFGLETNFKEDFGFQISLLVLPH